MARKLNQRLRELDKATSASSRGRSGSAPPSFGKEYDPEPPVELAAFVVFAFVGFLVLLGLAVLFGIRDVQRDVETRMERSLQALGVENVNVRVSGLDVRAGGRTDDLEVQAAAHALNDTFRNAGVVDVEIEYIPPREAVTTVPETDPLVLSWSPGRAIASGTLSGEGFRDQVVTALEDAFAIVDTSALGITEGAAAETSWLPGVLSLLGDVAAAAPQGEIVVNPSANVIQVSAEMETRQAQRNLRDDVEEALTRAGITFQFSSGITAKDVERVTKEQVEQTQTTLNEIIEGKVVEFEFGSAALTAQGTELLDEVLEGLREHPLVGVEIAGHTDDVGSSEDNLTLSEARAQAVVDYFVARGEDPNRFVVIGYGETQPVASNDTAAGRARNRRIEFTALFDEEAEEE